LGDWAINWCGCTVFYEQVLPTAHETHNETRLAFIVHSPRVAGTLCVHWTVVSALSQVALSKASTITDGMTARLAANRKIAKYPGCITYPFRVEDHGRVGEANLSFANIIAPIESPDGSKAPNTLYQNLVAVLHCASASAIIAAAT